jgi:uncharacterized protein
VEFEWDNEKAKRIWEDRAIDFLDVVRLFADRHVVLPSSRYDEERWRAVGLLDGRMITVVYTMRGETIRIVTARRAWKNEEREYYTHNP